MLYRSWPRTRSLRVIANGKSLGIVPGNAASRETVPSGSGREELPSAKNCTGSCGLIRPLLVMLPSSHERQIMQQAASEIGTNRLMCFLRRVPPAPEPRKSPSDSTLPKTAASPSDQISDPAAEETGKTRCARPAQIGEC